MPWTWCRSNYQFVHPRLAGLYPLPPEATRSNHGNGIVVKLLGLGEGGENMAVASVQFRYIVRVMRDISFKRI
jgi:hypothetical protein